jgi:hypothetical protein
MKAEIREYSTPDGSSFEARVPAGADNFGFLLQLYIGPLAMEGSESFEVEVLSPKRIESLCEKDGFCLGKGRFVVGRFDPDLVLRHLGKLEESAEGKDWNEIANKLSRISRWEFEV